MANIKYLLFAELLNFVSLSPTTSLFILNSRKPQKMWKLDLLAQRLRSKALMLSSEHEKAGRRCW